MSEADQQLNPAMQALITDAMIASNLGGVDIVHSHTWYTNMAGHFAKTLYKIPHVISAHSLEPDRPWKEEQIGGGYRISSWAEKTAYESADAIIAVSQGMRRDVLKAYHRSIPTRSMPFSMELIPILITHNQIQSCLTHLASRVLTQSSLVVSLVKKV